MKTTTPNSINSIKYITINTNESIKKNKKSTDWIRDPALKSGKGKSRKYFIGRATSSNKIWILQKGTSPSQNQQNNWSSAEGEVVSQNTGLEGNKALSEVDVLAHTGS